MKLKLILANLVAGFATTGAFAFDSGSTGSDGAFNPTVNTELQLPPSGVLNFTTVTIPSGVTVKFKKNALNTPVIILASGDVTIAGTIDIRGATGVDTGAAGSGNIGDDGLPGKGGPGGYDGGAGGGVPRKAAAAGLGPGGGMGMDLQSCIPNFIGYPTGSGGSFATEGTDSFPATACFTGSATVTISPILAGQTYGSSNLVPLIGGSGGGGGVGGDIFSGSGGGGGGGAILVASSGTMTISGSILASGGTQGNRTGDNTGSVGACGSGGAIKLVASTIAGNGTLNATGVPSGCQVAGGAGRIRLEADSITRTAASTPAHTFGTPGSLFVAGSPTLRISSVAGIAAPAEPTGSADIVLPSTTPNPVSVAFQTTGVPVGNTVKLTVTPASGVPFSAVTPALTGSTANASATVDVTLPNGPSTLSATTTYTIVASLGDAMSRFAQGERVERVALTSSPGLPDVVQLITSSGKVFDAPPAALAILAANPQQ